MTALRWKQGVDHAYYLNARKFGGSIVSTDAASPTANVQACFQNPNNRNIAFLQIIDDTYRSIVYNGFEHIMKSGMGTVAGGERNEGTYNSTPIVEGNTVRYTCYHKLPTGWTDDSPTNRFMIMQQWHKQAPVGSPPHHLAYGVSPTSGKLLLQPKYWDADITLESEMVELFIGKWVKVDTEFKWSTGADGYMKVYRNNSLVCTRTGQNMDSGDMPYWKFGLYRDPAINQDNSVWTKYPSQEIIG